MHAWLCRFGSRKRLRVGCGAVTGSSASWADQSNTRCGFGGPFVVGVGRSGGRTATARARSVLQTPRGIDSSCIPRARCEATGQRQMERSDRRSPARAPGFWRDSCSLRWRAAAKVPARQVVRPAARPRDLGTSVAHPASIPKPAASATRNASYATALAMFREYSKYPPNSRPLTDGAVDVAEPLTVAEPRSRARPRRF